MFIFVLCSVYLRQTGDDAAQGCSFRERQYGMFESVTQMLEQLTWIQLSKKLRKQPSHSLLQNYQQFGCGTTFMSGKG